MLEEVIYTPESRLRHPVHLVQEMWHSILDSRELAWRLTVRDISAQYRQSLLGYFWAFVPPIAAALIFVVLNNNGIISPGETPIQYAAFVLVGTVLWQTFVESVNAPLKVVLGAKQTLAKIHFPHEALIISAIGQVLFSFAIKLLILVGVFVYFDIPITWGLPVALLATMVLILLGIVIGLMMTPLGILFTDFSFGIMTLLSLWFFVTPVVYVAPTSFPFSLAATVNPVAPILTGTRDLATTGSLENATAFFVVVGVTLIGLLIAWILFRLSIPILIERMSA